MTAFVKGPFQVPVRPFVQQGIRRSAIETVYAAVGRKNGDVTDAAQVADHARLVLAAENGRVKCRDAWRALTTGGDVTAAEVGDDVDVGHFREQCGIVDLPRVALFRSMTYRLPVYADRADFRGRVAAHAGQFVTAHCVARRQRVRCKGFTLQFVVAGSLKGEECVAQTLREPDVSLAEHDGRLAGGELDGNAVHAVHARTRHQPKVHAVRHVACFRCLGPSRHVALLFDAGSPMTLFGQSLMQFLRPKRPRWTDYPRIDATR